MIYELPLVGFTTLAQTAVGAHIALSLYQWKNLDKPSRELHIARFIILGFMAIGFMCSTTHLGSPLRAFNAFNRVGASALSNEILTGSSFLTLAGLAWLTSLLNLGGRAIQKLLTALSVVVGVVFMFAMANVYYIPSVPTWFSMNTFVEFWFTVLTLGVLLAATLVQVLGLSRGCATKALALIGITFIAFHLASIVLQTLFFSGVTTAIHQGISQLQSLSGYLTAQVMLSAVAIVLWIISAFSALGKSTRSALLCITFVVLMVAELAGRNVFYGMHFTAGLY
ncbi:dimethyl sulfoxide reductase anchor subunit family protein [Vibrio ishigakensis]|uniref:dimethyl sulfoxide reductase anchor subunit family protein n=1 Tax=Vibrio ishigakensis TaxID=1481914 RepID=UPI0021C35D43|nr:DmsC/YnfH family molybdoenzyme membrane anchor subunit [Vibrio ishigakensis]